MTQDERYKTLELKLELPTFPMQFVLGKISIGQYGCWNWVGYKTKNTHGKRGGGYGRVRIKNKNYLVHRLVYASHVSQLKTGECVCHSCDNPSCINPRHLFSGSISENNKDKVKKGRYRNGNSNKTICKRGHNLLITGYTRPNGYRYCNLCRNERRKMLYVKTT